VAGAVARDLAAPIIGVVFRRAASPRAIVAVPETAVDENGELAPAVNYVRLAGEIRAMQAIAGGDLAERLAHRALRAGVAGLDGPDDGGALGGGHGPPAFMRGGLQSVLKFAVQYPLAGWL